MTLTCSGYLILLVNSWQQLTTAPSTKPSTSFAPTLPGICSDGSGRCRDESQCVCGAAGRLLKGKEGATKSKMLQQKNLRTLKKVQTPKPTGAPTSTVRPALHAVSFHIYWLFLSQISLVFLLTSFCHKPTQSPAACLCSIPVITTSPAPSLKPSLSPSAVPPGTCLDKGVACPCESEGQCTECCDGYCEVKGNKLKCWTAP